LILDYDSIKVPVIDAIPGSFRGEMQSFMLKNREKFVFDKKEKIR